jgi:small-conductance mechanosensitive channel
MSDHRLGIGSIAEPLLAIASIFLYITSKLYPSMEPFASNPILSAISLQLALGLSIIFLVAGLLVSYGRATYNERELHETVHILRLIAYPVLVIVLLHTLNISIASLLVGAGFLGIIVGLAAQTSLGSVFAGLSILYARPFAVGDKITFTPMSLGMQAPSYPHQPMFTEITGTVKSIGMIYTRVLRDDYSLLYIPNTALNQGFIQNHSRVSERLISVRLEVNRNTNIGQFKSNLVSRLSKNIAEFEKLKDLNVKISLMSTENDLGIIVTARANILDYDRLSQLLSENAVSALLAIQKRKR